MGACCVDANTRQIEARMKLMEHKQSRIRKVLMLGSGASGKTTLFKQLDWLYGVTDSLVDYHTKSFDKEDKISRLKTIRENIRDHIILLMKKSAELLNKNKIKYKNCDVNINNNIINDIQYLSKFQNTEFIKQYDPKWKELGKAIKRIWKTDGIQGTFSWRNEYSFSDNMDFFFDKCDKIFEESYIVTEEDFLKSRIRTTGVNTIYLEYENEKFTIVDVGGQRNERSKWIHQFSIVTAVIFVSALNHYNTVLFEDENINAMHESINLFEEIVNLKHFNQTDMIMFMNKDDLFRIELNKGYTLDVCFNKKNGWNGVQWGLQENEINYDTNRYEEESKDDIEYFNECHRQAILFIRQRYQEVCRKKNKVIHFHTTTATDKQIVQKVFWDIQHIILRGTLETAGMIEL